uniref:Uncharacterized protein n=1 Tax=Heterorhabditis bacteriophora TaxID=37862 RepID=A0A1I7WGZ2_HETBA
MTYTSSIKTYTPLYLMFVSALAKPLRIQQMRSV